MTPKSTSSSYVSSAGSEFAGSTIDLMHGAQVPAQVQRGPIHEFALDLMNAPIASHCFKLYYIMGLYG